ncbi:MAG: asparagine synthase (glutamine-hydrolyzing) [candidate division KSB1 bacterium]|nr:asparagine synthase (glutamine-hydrolyzing) [candidate division KSB1 bacterium]
MCGICGVFNRNPEHHVDPRDIKRMCDAIVHRGPDQQGAYVSANIGIGMRRLSIIDLSTGNQPIFNEDGSLAIVFNGEIYNHQQLRKELVAKGHRFKTHSDTEAIVHAYEEYGEACPEKLNGMFAFAIWDRKRQSVFLARDRIGIKPLYYYIDANRLVFGSELKSILKISDIPRQVNAKALDTFLTFEYIPSPYSIFDNIHKLPPGHSLTVARDRHSLKQYWTFEYNTLDYNEQQLKSRFVELLEDSVNIRLMSDVPLGAFLSGGLDSSSIVALMSRHTNGPVKSFSIGFDNSTYNELPFARAVANQYQTEHYEEIIQPDALSLTERIIRQLDEPFGDFSVFPTLLVSEMARKYVTVVLSGDGGDELLGGYDTYIAQNMARRYARLPALLRKYPIEALINLLPPTEKKKGLVNRAKRFVEGMRLPDHLQHVRWMIFLQSAEKQMLYDPEFQRSLNDYDSFGFIKEAFRNSGSSTPLDQQEYVDIKTYLVDDILVKVDRMSMAASLETRVPFLDHRFVEFAATIPAHYRLRGKQTKAILKDTMRPLLPDMILKRGKEGFSIPIKTWMKNELRPLMTDVLSERNVKEKGFFSPTVVQKLVREHLQNRENHSHRLWGLMMFHMWYDIYMKAD